MSIDTMHVVVARRPSSSALPPSDLDGYVVRRRSAAPGRPRVVRGRPATGRAQVASAAVAPDKEFGRASVQGRRICSPIQAATSPPSAVVAIGKRRPFSGYELSEQCPGIAVQRAVPVPPCLWQVQRPKRPMSVMTFPRNEEVVSPRLTRTRFRVQSASRQGVPRKHTVSRVPGGPCLAPAVKTKSLVDRFVEQLMTPNMILGLPSPAQPAPKHTTLHRRGHSR